VKTAYDCAVGWRRRVRV